MMRNSVVLRDFLTGNGLDKNESAIYLFLLECGAQPVSVIGKRVKIKRTSCYSYIERLMEKGYVGIEKKDGVTMVRAIELEPVLNRIEEDLFEKYDSDVKKLGYIKKIIPLLAYGKYSLREPRVNVYTGENALKRIYEESLEGEFLMAYFSASYDNNEHNEADDWHTAERVRKEIPIRIILPDTESAMKFANVEKPFKQVKVIDSERFPFEGATLINNDRVLMFSMEDNIGVSIECPFLAKNQGSIFNLLWDSVDK